MAVTEDVELTEVLLILVLVIFIGYEIYKAGGSISDWLSNLFNKLGNIGSGPTPFGSGNSGNGQNDNSLPPTTTTDGSCSFGICTGIGG